jgi:hypothetical protein
MHGCQHNGIWAGQHRTTQNSARQKTGGDDEILASKGLLLFLAAG